MAEIIQINGIEKNEETKANEPVFEPVVCFVGDHYHVMIPCEKQYVMWVNVDGKDYFDDVCGVMRSDVKVHRANVPMEALNSAKEYTVYLKEVLDKKIYHEKSGEIFSKTFPFKPYTYKEEPVFYFLSDAHGRDHSPTNCFEKSKCEPDIIIFGGDFFDHEKGDGFYKPLYKTAFEISKGELPVINVRGNHDVRGAEGEKVYEYLPTKFGKTFYSFRIGDIWGLVLDCGEEKDDGDESYAGFLCCHSMRIDETEFIENIIKNADSEYSAEGVKHKIIISHTPFTYFSRDKYNIEEEIYSEWAKLLKENVKPDVMLCGHTHEYGIFRVGGHHDKIGQPCPIVIGSQPGDGNGRKFVASKIKLAKEGIKVKFNDDNGNVLAKYLIKYKEK